MAEAAARAHEHEHGGRCAAREHILAASPAYSPPVRHLAAGADPFWRPGRFSRRHEGLLAVVADAPGSRSDRTAPASLSAGVAGRRPARARPHRRSTSLRSFVRDRLAAPGSRCPPSRPDAERQHRSRPIVVIGSCVAPIEETVRRRSRGQALGRARPCSRSRDVPRWPPWVGVCRTKLIAYGGSRSRATAGARPPRSSPRCRPRAPAGRCARGSRARSARCRRGVRRPKNTSAAMKKLSSPVASHLGRQPPW